MITDPARATIVITTKNRKDELRGALESAVSQTAPVEVLVMDDGSIDGTAEMVTTDFPQVRIERTEVSHGLIAQRNRAARSASAPILFSIDDDAEFSSPHVVQQTLAEFDDSRVAAVAIPYVEPRKDNRVMQQAPSREGTWITDTFIGTAHALRREVFLRLGGYREDLVHQGEEGDLCIRLLDAGYVVRLGGADVIHHYESPRRDLRRMDFYGPRNGLLFVWQNVPMPMMPIHLAGTSLKCALWSLKPRRLFTRLSGMVAGGMAFSRLRRQPVSREAYRLFRWLRRNGPRPLAEIQGQLARLLDAEKPERIPHLGPLVTLK